MRYIAITILASLAIFQFTSCVDEFPYEDNGVLQFSTDTLTFDTVFTAVGSATRSFKVINASNKAIEIDRITLAGGQNSDFRLNVDGVPTKTSVENVRIPAQDSIYIFAEVSVDPNNSNNPFIIYDEVRFDFNGQEQRVTLEAWGQNAVYVGSKGGLAELVCPSSGEIVWDATKPYVVYGVLFVNNCKLRIEAGARIHVHGALIDADSFYYNDGVIFVLEGGSIEINGTKDNPVIIEGDRLESDFNEVPGQWAGILLGANSKGNKFNYVEIKNSIVGVRIDSMASLTLTNSIIHNTLSSNLLAYHAEKVLAENCLFYSSSGGNCVQLEYGGGEYDFRHCTMAGFSSVSNNNHSSPVLRMGNFICLDDQLGCPNYAVNTMNANFQNCIIYGSRPTEISISERDEGFFNYTMENCLIKLDSAENFNVPILNDCINCLVNKDPLFKNIYQLNYQLDTLSPAEAFGKGFLQSRLTGAIIDKDLINNARNTSQPDAGCYEYQY
jgi:hypothetical protein